MAIAAAHSLARTAEKKGLSPTYIIPTMDQVEVFPAEARDVAMQAIEDGVAGLDLTAEQVYRKAESDILEAREITHRMMEQNLIKKPPVSILESALKHAIKSVTE